MQYYQYHRSPTLRFVCSARDGVSVKAYAPMIRHLVKHTEFARRPAFAHLNPMERKLGMFRVTKMMVTEYFDYRDPPFGSRCIRALPFPIKTELRYKYRDKLRWVSVEAEDQLYCLKDVHQLADPLPRLAMAQDTFDVLACDQKQWDSQCDRILSNLQEIDLKKYAFLYDILPHILLTTDGHIAVDRA